MFDDADSWQIIFFLSAALFVAFQIFRGWRLGVVRQLINLLALIVAYAVAIFGGRMAVPVLHPLGYPDFLVSFVAGAILALAVYLAITLAGRILFRRTNQQGLGLLRLGYGVGGSAIGMIFGFLTVWLVVLAIRLLGTVAETELAAAEPAPHRSHRNPPPPPPFAQSMAHMKQSLEQGTAGAIVQSIDPLPARAYAILTKVTRVIGSREAMERFLNFPGAKPLSEHPRIIALQNDPAVSHEVEQRNYLALLKNESIVQAVNDPEISRLVSKFELEKALDYALSAHEKTAATHSRE